MESPFYEAGGGLRVRTKEYGYKPLRSSVRKGKTAVQKRLGTLVSLQDRTRSTNRRCKFPTFPTPRELLHGSGVARKSVIGRLVYVLQYVP